MDRPWNVAEVVRADYDSSDRGDKPNVFIQWKATDVCFDFFCDCVGGGGHYDGYFAYAFKCPGCGAVFEMPFTVFPLRVERSEYEPVELG